MDTKNKVIFYLIGFCFILLWYTKVNGYDTIPIDNTIKNVATSSMINQQPTIVNNEINDNTTRYGIYKPSVYNVNKEQLNIISKKFGLLHGFEESTHSYIIFSKDRKQSLFVSKASDMSPIVFTSSYRFSNTAKTENELKEIAKTFCEKHFINFNYTSSDVIRNVLSDELVEVVFYKSLDGLRVDTHANKVTLDIYGNIITAENYPQQFEKTDFVHLERNVVHKYEYDSESKTIRPIS